jgi:hypothetical protein
MAREKDREFVLPAEYELTPEEKAAARAEAEKLGEEAARNGVYEKLLELEGKVPLDPEFYRRLREDW